MSNKKDILSNSSVTNKDSFNNSKKIPGDSIDTHRVLEEANVMITGDEIKQQNENL